MSKYSHYMIHTLLISTLPCLCAFAECAINNETNIDFYVNSGSQMHQSVGAHTDTWIHEGVIIGTSKTGASISGSCKDGDSMDIKLIDGVPVLVPHQ